MSGHVEVKLWPDPRAGWCFRFENEHGGQMMTVGVGERQAFTKKDAMAATRARLEQEGIDDYNITVGRMVTQFVPLENDTINEAVTAAYAALEDRRTGRTRSWDAVRRSLDKLVEMVR